MRFFHQGGRKKKEDKTIERTHTHSSSYEALDHLSILRSETWDQSLSRQFVSLTTDRYGANNTSSNKLDVGTFRPNQYKSCVL